MNSKVFEQYSKELVRQIENISFKKINILVEALYARFKTNKQVFLIGNGGSGGNANHIANDFIYPISKTIGVGLKAHSLVANPATISCIANDEGYEKIFSCQLEVFGETGDILIALSGTGNSTNIIKCIESAKNMGIRTFSMLGFDGGRCLDISDDVLLFDSSDMQVCEDMQMFVANVVLKELFIKINRSV